MLGFTPISNQAISDIELPIITGTIYTTDSNDSATLTGAVAIVGNINVTDGTDTATIYAQELVSGYILATDGNDTSDLEGAVAVTGTISATDGTDTSDFEGQVLVTASISTTDSNDTADFEGAIEEDGSIYTIDDNDTCDIVGYVTPGTPTNIDMHDGFTKREIELARALDKKRRIAEQKLIEARKADAAARKQRFRDLIDPQPKVSKHKQNKVESKQEIRIDTPSIEVKRIESVIANLDRQEKELQQAIAYRKQLAETTAILAILDAKFKAEQDDEEALLMLL